MERSASPFFPVGLGTSKKDYVKSKPLPVVRAPSPSSFAALPKRSPIM